MRLEFDITLTAKDMFRFNLYQTYTGASGWISVIAAVVCFAAAGTKYSERGASYTVLGILLGALILFYMPVTLYLRSKQRIAASEVLKNSLHYCVDGEGISVTQGDADAKLMWDQVGNPNLSPQTSDCTDQPTPAAILPTSLACPNRWLAQR